MTTNNPLFQLDDTKNMYEFYTKDALEFLKQIQDNSIDMVLTDPPYFINEEISVIRRSNKMKFSWKDIDFKKDTEWDRVWHDKNEFRQWLKELLKDFFRVLKDNKHCVIFCDKRDINYIQDFWEELWFKVRQILVRRKTNPVPRARKISPMTTIETAVWLTKWKAKVDEYNWQLWMFKDVIDCPIPRNEWNIERHSTQKPLFLIEFLIALLSKPGDTILDPFVWWWTTLASALALWRKAIVNDLDPKWKENWFKCKNERLSYADKIKRTKLLDFIKQYKHSQTTNEIIKELLNI